MRTTTGRRLIAELVAPSWSSEGKHANQRRKPSAKNAPMSTNDTISQSRKFSVQSRRALRNNSISTFTALILSHKNKENGKTISPTVPPSVLTPSQLRSSMRPTFTERIESLELDESLAVLKRERRERKERLADVYDGRFEPLLELYHLLSLPENRFRSPLYQLFVSKCPVFMISASRYMAVLSEAYEFDDLRDLERLIRKIVNTFQGTPFTKVDDSYRHCIKESALESPKVKRADFREICCAMRIFQFPKEEATRRLDSMFDIFDVKKIRRLRRVDLSKLFHTPAVQFSEHAEMARLVDEAFGPMRAGRRIITQDVFRSRVRTNPELVERLHTLCYQRLPMQRRLELRAARALRSKREANFVRRKLQWRSVRSFYQRYCSNDNMRRTWDRWRSFVFERRMLKRADAYRLRYLKRKGTTKWGKFVEWRLETRAKMQKAKAHYCRTRSASIFFRWYCAYMTMRAMRREMLRRALAFRRATLLRRYRDRWWWYMLNEKARKFRRRMQLLIAMLGWSEYIKATKEEMRLEELRALEQIARVKKDVERANEQAESILMEKEEDRTRELMRRQELEILQRQRDEEYAMKLDYATHRAHQRRLWRRQVESRLANKKKLAKQEKRDFKTTWTTLEEKSIKACRDDTLNWVRTTKEGQTTIRVAAKRIFQIWNECTEEFDSPPMALWQGIFDPVYGTLFFFNTETKEKIGEKTFTMAQSKMVAIDHYLARQMAANVDTTLTTKRREKQSNLEHKSAMYIQDLWRRRKSRKMMREIVRRMFNVRYDVESGELYYYHVLRRTKQQMKPRMLGKEKICPPAYARVKDIKGKFIFLNTGKPWMSTPEKPAGYLLCSECNFFLARRYCKQCKERFCIDCHYNFHKKGKRRGHEWDDFPVKQQICDFCKEKIACVSCHACGGATYCEKCSGMVHRSGPNAKHALEDF